MEINRNDKLYRQYFPLLPHCLRLDEAIKIEFLNEVNRVSVKSKVASLVNASDEIIFYLKCEDR